MPLTPVFFWGSSRERSLAQVGQLQEWLNHAIQMASGLQQPYHDADALRGRTQAEADDSALTELRQDIANIAAAFGYRLFMDPDHPNPEKPTKPKRVICRYSKPGSWSWCTRLKGHDGAHTQNGTYTPGH